MLNLYITRLKCLMRQKSNIFWTLLFPMILATFFSIAFANLYNEEIFKTIPVAVINNQAYEKDTTFQSTLKTATFSEKGDKIFKIIECSEEEAKDLLDNNKVDGIIDVSDDYGLTVKISDINQTILKSFLTSYRQNLNIITSIAKEDPSKLNSAVAELVESNSYIKEQVTSKNKPDTTVNYYYALIAMACLYGCFWGLAEISDIQADQSAKGARINVAPIHKMKLLFCNLFAATTIQVCNVFLLIAYLVFALKINFGNDTLYILLTCVMGSITGITMGAMVAAVVKKDRESNTGLLSAISMLCSFLAGLMIVSMRYIVQVNAPILNYINPAALITDSLYSLYYYDSYNQFFMNMAILGIIACIFGLITYLVTRRRDYASI